MDLVLNPVLSLPDCVGAIQTLACIGLTLDAAEILCMRHEYKRGGIYDWDLVRGFWPWTASARLSPVLSAFLGYPNYLVVVAVQLLSALLLLTQPLPAFALPLVLIILTTRILFLFRHQYGGEGADQIQVIVFTGLAAYYVAPDALGQHAGVWFIGLQAMVAYVAAGLTKMRSPAWREGRALAGAMNTAAFGNQVAARVLDRAPRVSRVLCWSTILFECVCPLLTFVGPVPCLVFITCGVLFHVSNAVLLGLNKFLWSFTATYPAILLISLDLNVASVVQGPDTAGLRVWEWLGTLTTATWMGLLVGVVGWWLLLDQGWWMWQLLRQHGRLLMRLEQVEAAMAGAGGASDWPRLAPDRSGRAAQRRLAQPVSPPEQESPR